jgi:hypothetical protein
MVANNQGVANSADTVHGQCLLSLESVRGKSTVSTLPVDSVGLDFLESTVYFLCYKEC